MDYTVFLPVLISFALSRDPGTGDHSYLTETENGTDGEGRRREVSPEEGGDAHHGRGDHPFERSGHIPSLSQGLSQDHPHFVCNSGLWADRFPDDYLKVVMKRSDGLYPKQKMALQIVVTAIFAFYLIRFTDVSLAMLIPFTGGKYLDIGWLAVPLLFFAVIGTVNGVNFTDGLDGLASSVTVLVATFFTVVAIGTKSGIEPVTCAVVGALLGFLLFNVYPASVFMGDTGSLALGGFVASTAYMLQMPIFILIVGLIYLVEVLSVMIQVTYFKKTGGKRIFKMAPIHHHFELCGWSETRVVAVFSIITALLCLIALMAM